MPTYDRRQAAVDVDFSAAKMACNDVYDVCLRVAKAASAASKAATTAPVEEYWKAVRDAANEAATYWVNVGFMARDAKKSWQEVSKACTTAQALTERAGKPPRDAYSENLDFGEGVQTFNKDTAIYWHKVAQKADQALQFWKKIEENASL